MERPSRRPAIDKERKRQFQAAKTLRAERALAEQPVEEPVSSELSIVLAEVEVEPPTPEVLEQEADIRRQARLSASFLRSMRVVLFDDGGAPAWHRDALCAQTDPEAFFPERGGSTREAKKVCFMCDVTDACLKYALSNDERFGIWGGLSERERRRLKKKSIDT